MIDLPYWKDQCPTCGKVATSASRGIPQVRSCMSGHQWVRPIGHTALVRPKGTKLHVVARSTEPGITQYLHYARGANLRDTWYTYSCELNGDAIFVMYEDAVAALQQFNKQRNDLEAEMKLPLEALDPPFEVMALYCETTKI